LYIFCNRKLEDFSADNFPESSKQLVLSSAKAMNSSPLSVMKNGTHNDSSAVDIPPG